MQFIEKWLREWVNPDCDYKQLAYVLTMSGLEVENTVPVAPAFSHVVVAKIVSVVPHVNADRLKIVLVDVGCDDLLQIVCGSPNVKEGMNVPCALSGAVLPNNMEIKPTSMRGVVSNGMLCSAKELCISEDSVGLMVLPEDAPIGVSLREYLQLDDQIFTLKITPNRADCLSIKGIAREISALTECSINEVNISSQSIQHDQKLAVNIIQKNLCGRYVGRIVKSVNPVAKTPIWMTKKLISSGVRPVSAIVDIANFVMLELGQPLHAFDLDEISGGIQVRLAKNNEYLVCINGKTVCLDDDTLLIADDDKPLAIAGFMGGVESSVTDLTKNIFLESAYFSPEAILGKSRKFGFSSEASYRYERGVDPLLQVQAIERATALILEICGGSVGIITHEIGILPERKVVDLRAARVEKVLGITLSTEDIAAIFTRLDFDFTEKNSVFSVKIPSYRFDLNIEEDLIEEVARIFGYENITFRPPESSLRMQPQPEGHVETDVLRQIMTQRDYQEVICYAFSDEKNESDFSDNALPVKLLNPIANQYSVMRSSLLGSLVQSLVNGINRKQTRVRLFEISRVFQKAKETDSIAQPWKIAGLAWGNRYSEQWNLNEELVDFYDLKSDVDALVYPRKVDYEKFQHPAFHPGKIAKITLGNQMIGFLGELHPELIQKYNLVHSPVFFELDLAIVQNRNVVKVKMISKFPCVRRDLAVIVKEDIQVDTILQVLNKNAPSIVREIVLFDLYKGKSIDLGMKSLAFKVILQDDSKTLTDDEINQTMEVLVKAAKSAGAILR